MVGNTRLSMFSGEDAQLSSNNTTLDREDTRNMIYVAITRPGKDTAHVELDKGSTVEDAFVKANFSRDDYSKWSITDEDGDSLGLTDTLNNSGQLICGAKVSGASR